MYARRDMRTYRAMPNLAGETPLYASLGHVADGRGASPHICEKARSAPRGAPVAALRGESGMWAGERGVEPWNGCSGGQRGVTDSSR